MHDTHKTEILGMLNHVVLTCCIGYTCYIRTVKKKRLSLIRMYCQHGYYGSTTRIHGTQRNTVIVVREYPGVDNNTQRFFLGFVLRE